MPPFQPEKNNPVPPPESGRDKHFTFYQDVLETLLEQREITLTSSLLVICGGPNDKDVLDGLGFTNITFCNVDDRMEEGEKMFHPHQWRFENGQNLSFEDRAFDWVLVHSGLHHLHLPLTGLTEMYRVARVGVLGFEPNNGFLSRLGVRLGFGQQYETAAVFDNGMTHGGVENTEIPNHVFRFNADTIRQTIRTYDPTAVIRDRFWYRTRVPVRLYMLRNPVYGWLARIFGVVLTTLGRFPALANNMAFAIWKPDPEADLHPWLRLQEGRPRINPDALQKQYASKSENE